MRALDLDYQAGARRSGIGTVVLAAGVLMATVALAEYRSVREEQAAWESRVAEVRATAKRGEAGTARVSRDRDAAAQEIRLARLALQRLSARWTELFGALESARSDGVALLAIEPDPGRSTVKLTAEARSPEHMLAYVERLQGADILADVTLASHQIRESAPGKPLRFAVVASWASQP